MFDTRRREFITLLGGAVVITGGSGRLRDPVIWLAEQHRR
jgi:hypothetical protein